MILEHLRESIARSHERIKDLECKRQDLIRRSRILTRKKDEDAWRKVEAKIDAAIKRWQGGENNGSIKRST